MIKPLDGLHRKRGVAAPGDERSRAPHPSPPPRGTCLLSPSPQGEEGFGMRGIPPGNQQRRKRNRDRGAPHRGIPPRKIQLAFLPLMYRAACWGGLSRFSQSPTYPPLNSIAPASPIKIRDAANPRPLNDKKLLASLGFSQTRRPTA
mgnify:CR=1 FL=1